MPQKRETNKESVASQSLTEPSSDVQKLASLSQILNIETKPRVTFGTPMPSQNPETGWQYSFCMGCMQADCSTKIYLEGGVVVNIEGNPESPLNQGKVCPRAITAIMGLYNPYRVKTPLKRTNPEKGPEVDPGWVEITWEEAIDTVAKRLKKIRQDDPRKLAVWEGWGAPEDFLITCKEIDKSVNYKYGFLIFSKAFGTPNEVFGRNLCAIHYPCNLIHGQHPEYIADLQHCQYLIAPGRNVGLNTASTHATRRFLDAIDRGMKLVTLDPRFSPDAAKAYRWLPVRPGTELAFALAMLNVIFYELKKFDEWFVKNRTNGPYLIGPDGYYVRDKSTKKPVIWDSVDHKAKAFDDPSIRDYSLEGKYTVEGTEATPALQLIKERMKEYTPEWAEGITSIPASSIREVTAEFIEHAQIGSTIAIDGFEFPLRPAQFAGSGRGTMSQKGGTYFDLARNMINMLVGSVEVPGGMTGNRNPGACAQAIEPNEDGISTPIMESIGTPFTFPPEHVSMNEFYPHSHATPQVLARAVLDPKKYYLTYELEAMLNCGANSIRASCDRQILIDAFKKVPFIVTFALNFDEVAMMADIVFPEHQFLERKYARFYLVTHQNIDDSIRGLVMALGRNPVKPLFNTRRMDDVLIEIADRVGFLTGTGGINDLVNLAFQLKGKNKLDLDQKYTIDEMIDRRIKQVFGDEYSFDHLLKHGIVYKFDAIGKRGYNYYYWPGNKTRHPIYFDMLKASGERMRENLKKHNIKLPNWKDQEDYFKYFQAIPYWIPGPELTALPEYDMWACNWKTSFMTFGASNAQENAWLAEFREEDPYEMYVWINSETASKKGFKDEDEVWVGSRYGKTVGKLKLTELIHPEVVGIPACYGSNTIMMSPDAKKGTYFNILMTGQEDTGFDPVSGSVTISPRVKVYKVEQSK
jgi:anaerobic selenocysteine-containing dehydrogenase